MRSFYSAWTLAGIAFVLILSANACGRSNERPALRARDFGAAGTKAEVYRIFETLQSNVGVGKSLPRDPSLNPENLLPRLHGWLSLQRGLKKTVINGRRAVILKDLPAAVLNRLEAITFADRERKSGFAILQSSFWKGVKRLMDQGIHIGFMDYNPSEELSGIYYDDQRTILVDSFANEGTLLHEYRHYQQYRRLEQQPQSLQRVFSETCLATASRSFAELDATTAELPSWIGVFQSINIHPKWDLSVEPDWFENDHFSQVDLLTCNLEYPGDAARWTIRLRGPDACPDELRNALIEIADFTDNFNLETGREAFRIIVDQVTDIRDRIGLVRNRCDDSLADATAASSPECARLQVNLEGLPSRAQAAKDELDQRFESAHGQRLAFIRMTLNRLPEDQKTVLCRHALGFASLADCGPALSK